MWQDVTVPAAQHGLAALAGNAATVGVTGYTLGGGLGWLARRYGLAANSVTAAELVTPDGNLVRANAGHESDLFWAVRGGGGIGVVTALEMRLYPVGDLYAGSLFFPIARAAEVLHAWREWTDTVPDEVSSRAAWCGCRRRRSSPNRCAAGPSSRSRPPTSATRAPAQS